MISITVEILLWIIMVLLLVCFVCIVYIMMQRGRVDQQDRRAKRYLEKTKTLWESYLLEDGFFSVVLIPRGKSEIVAVESLFLSYIHNMYNEEVEEKVREFSKKYLIKHYEKELKDKNWGKRMNALYKIIDFHLVELVLIYESLNREMKTKEEQFVLLKIYSVFDKEKFFTIIFSNKYTFSEIEYKQIFSLLDEDILLQLIEQIEELHLNAQYALIDTVSFKGNIEIIKMLENLLTSSDSEIRIRSLKGIDKMGLVKNFELYIPFVTSPLWEERLMVAKVFLHVPLKFTYAYLMDLLEDTNWRVQTQAANTISEFPDGVQVLNEFILTSVKEDAVKIAEEMLTKRFNLQ
ncbi:HEAT repeat domain-containing protein [Lysinibacillus sp. BW-2-10]|uniref:HEAT repeat domain-containing protein n=1 Tax=Lysinibacillus sp. BW-2-10 TaxID=2590030 RepID=UPI00117C06BE|nr:HEAT repeat domain-containing protein [Lysinibacillus sp. BW-2-10]TSI11468.1 HEAT repeat domain-containing protein [Lysinibacillus sp. BW-2-10]